MSNKIILQKYKLEKLVIKHNDKVREGLLVN